jgi:hypothetical protein
VRDVAVRDGIVETGALGLELGLQPITPRHRIGRFAPYPLSSTHLA